MFKCRLFLFSPFWIMEMVEVRVKTSIKYVTHVNIYIQKGRKNYLNSLYYECSNKYMWIIERIDG